MCHPDVPPGRATSASERIEVGVTVPGGETMSALLRGDADRPPVLLVGDVFGRSPFYENLAGVIAEAGFQVLLPDFFFREGELTEMSKDAAFARRGSLDEARSLEDLAAAIAFLRERSGQNAVGTIGFCMGGTFVLDLASSDTNLVTVAYYGFPVPQASLTMPPPRPIDQVGAQRGPVLAFWGENDDAVGAENVASYVPLAAAANPGFEHEVVAGLGHGFLGAADLADPEDPGGRTWMRAISHLQTHLPAA
jgi:carboxymethylenebutenolidase